MPITAAVTNRNFAWTSIANDPQFKAVLDSSEASAAIVWLKTLIREGSRDWYLYASFWNHILSMSDADPMPKPSKYRAWNENLKAYQIPMEFSDDGNLTVIKNPKTPGA